SLSTVALGGGKPVVKLYWSQGYRGRALMTACFGRNDAEGIVDRVITAPHHNIRFTFALKGHEKPVEVIMVWAEQGGEVPESAADEVRKLMEQPYAGIPRLARSPVTAREPSGTDSDAAAAKVLALNGTSIADKSGETYTMGVRTCESAVYPILIEIVNHDGHIVGSAQFGISAESATEAPLCVLGLVNIADNLFGINYQGNGIFGAMMERVSACLAGETVLKIASLEDTVTLQKLATGSSWEETPMGKSMSRAGWVIDALGIYDQTIKAPKKGRIPPTAMLIDRNDKYPQVPGPDRFNDILRRAVTHIERTGHIDKALLFVQLRQRDRANKITSAYLYRDFEEVLKHEHDNPAVLSTRANTFWETLMTVRQTDPGKGLPLIAENNRDVFFLWKGSAREVLLRGDMNGWQKDGFEFTRLGDTDIYYLRQSYEPDTRLDYKLSIDGRMIRDPLNPRASPYTIAGGLDYNSEIAMPAHADAVSALLKQPCPAEKQGRLSQPFTIPGENGNSFPVRVYTPCGYDTANQRYPTLYIHDETEMLIPGVVYLKELLDALIADGTLAPCIAVFIKAPEDRPDKYSGNDGYARSFVETLIPAIECQYRTEKTAASRCVGGTCLGGTIALYTAFKYPDIVSNAFGLSTQISGPKHSLIDVCRQTPPAIKKSLRVFAAFGSYEKNVLSVLPDGKPDTIDYAGTNQEFADNFKNEGWLESRIYHQGHSWGSWRNELPDALRYFLGARPTVPDGSLGRAVATINGSKRLKKNAFTKSEFRVCRMNPETGKLFSNRTVYAELNGLVGCGIVQITDKSVRPRRYALTEAYRRAPPYVKKDINDYLKTLSARPTAAELKKAKAEIGKQLSPHERIARVFTVVSKLLLGRPKDSAYVNVGEVAEKIKGHISDNDVKVMLEKLVRARLLTVTYRGAGGIPVFSFTRTGDTASRRRVNVSDYLRMIDENIATTLKLFRWPSGSSKVGFSSLALRWEMRSLLESGNMNGALALAREAAKFLDYTGPHEKEIYEAAKALFDDVPARYLLKPLPAKIKKKLESTEGLLENERYYIDRIIQYPMLTLLGEVVLSVRTKFGDQKARKLIWEGNLRLVVNRAKVMKRRYPHLLLIDDLVSSGNEALDPAITKFAPQRGQKFGTYLVWWIEQKMRRSIHDSDSTVRIPPSRRDKRSKFLKACRRAGIDDPSDTRYSSEEIAQATHLSVNAVEDLRRVRHKSFSMDKHLGEGVEEDESDSAAFGTVFGEVDERVAEIDYRDALAKTIAVMEGQLQNPRAWNVWRVKTRPNLEGTLTGEEWVTLETAGKEIGVSRERVRQVEVRYIDRQLIEVARAQGMNLARYIQQTKSERKAGTTSQLATRHTVATAPAGLSPLGLGWYAARKEWVTLLVNTPLMRFVSMHDNKSFKDWVSRSAGLVFIWAAMGAFVAGALVFLSPAAFTLGYWTGWALLGMSVPVSLVGVNILAHGIYNTCAAAAPKILSMLSSETPQPEKDIHLIDQRWAHYFGMNEISDQFEARGIRGMIEKFSQGADRRIPLEDFLREYEDSYGTEAVFEAILPSKRNMDPADERIVIIIRVGKEVFYDVYGVERVADLLDDTAESDYLFSYGAVASIGSPWELTQFDIFRIQTTGNEVFHRMLLRNKTALGRETLTLMPLEKAPRQIIPLQCIGEDANPVEIDPVKGVIDSGEIFVVYEPGHGWVQRYFKDGAIVHAQTPVAKTPVRAEAQKATPQEQQLQKAHENSIKALRYLKDLSAKGHIVPPYILGRPGQDMPSPASFDDAIGFVGRHHNSVVTFRYSDRLYHMANDNPEEIVSEAADPGAEALRALVRQKGILLSLREISEIYIEDIPPDYLSGVRSTGLGYVLDEVASFVRIMDEWFTSLPAARTVARDPESHKLRNTFRAIFSGAGNASQMDLARSDIMLGALGSAKQRLDAVIVRSRDIIRSLNVDPFADDDETFYQLTGFRSDAEIPPPGSVGEEDQENEDDPSHLVRFFEVMGHRQTLKDAEALRAALDDPDSAVVKELQSQLVLPSSGIAQAFRDLLRQADLHFSPGPAGPYESRFFEDKETDKSLGADIRISSAPPWHYDLSIELYGFRSSAFGLPVTLKNVTTGELITRRVRKFEAKQAMTIPGISSVAEGVIFENLEPGQEYAILSEPASGPQLATRTTIALAPAGISKLGFGWYAAKKEWASLLINTPLMRFLSMHDNKGFKDWASRSFGLIGIWAAMGAFVAGVLVFLSPAAFTLGYWTGWALLGMSVPVSSVGVNIVAHGLYNTAAVAVPEILSMLMQAKDDAGVKAKMAKTLQLLEEMEQEKESLGKYRNTLEIVKEVLRITPHETLARFDTEDEVHEQLGDKVYPQRELGRKLDISRGTISLHKKMVYKIILCPDEAREIIFKSIEGKEGMHRKQSFSEVRGDAMEAAKNRPAPTHRIYKNADVAAATRRFDVLDQEAEELIFEARRIREKEAASLLCTRLTETDDAVSMLITTLEDMEESGVFIGEFLTTARLREREISDAILLLHPIINEESETTRLVTKPIPAVSREHLLLKKRSEHYFDMSYGRLCALLEEIQGVDPLTEKKKIRFDLIERALTDLEKAARAMRLTANPDSPEYLSGSEATAKAASILRKYDIKFATMDRRFSSSINAARFLNITPLEEKMWKAGTHVYKYIVAEIAGEYFIIDLAAGRFLGNPANLGMLIAPLEALYDAPWPYGGGEIINGNESELLYLVNRDNETLEKILHPERVTEQPDVTQLATRDTIETAPAGISPLGLGWYAAKKEWLSLLANTLLMRFLSMHGNKGFKDWASRSFGLIGIWAAMGAFVAGVFYFLSPAAFVLGYWSGWAALSSSIPMSLVGVNMLAHGLYNTAAVAWPKM
ncbi:MAG: sigma-70 family RNA polymerase sigma factor, partial [Candidatus Omnitrophica bacterium]|nr:sigma-70 family RNA polymerase sigma factor [Candidatus Omnitrophota bacterium]